MLDPDPFRIRIKSLRVRNPGCYSGDPDELCVLFVARELEREVNVGWTDIVPESEADGSLLALMLYRSGFILIIYPQRDEECK
jgi:hypothetical protein